jgi:hypothetical protein
MSAYFNVHGQPLAVSARDAVLVREPQAYAKVSKVLRHGRKRPEDYWEICRARTDGKRRNSDRVIGDGANEESAWRHTLSRMRVSDEEEAAA